MGFHVCFGSGIFHVPSLGNLEENVSCSQLCALPHCIPLPSLVKVKTKPAQTPHC